MLKRETRVVPALFNIDTAKRTRRFSVYLEQASLLVKSLRRQMKKNGEFVVPSANFGSVILKAYDEDTKISEVDLEDALRHDFIRLNMHRYSRKLMRPTMKVCNGNLST